MKVCKCSVCACACVCAVEITRAIPTDVTPKLTRVACAERGAFQISILGKMDGVGVMQSFDPLVLEKIYVTKLCCLTKCAFIDDTICNFNCILSIRTMQLITLHTRAAVRSLDLNEARAVKKKLRVYSVSLLLLCLPRQL